MKNTVYLGSKSSSRKELLESSGFSVICLGQDANEQECDWGLPLQKLLESIAIHKMEHVVLPSDAKEGDVIYVITGDTMGIDINGNIGSKPQNKAAVIERLKLYRKGATTGTAICVDRKRFSGGAWIIEERIVDYASAEYIYDVPDELLESYIDDLPRYVGLEYTQISGGITVKGYGNRYLKRLSGSYSAVVGLPMYEVTAALRKLGFFTKDIA